MQEQTETQQVDRFNRRIQILITCMWLYFHDHDNKKCFTLLNKNAANCVLLTLFQTIVTAAILGQQLPQCTRS